MKSSGKMRFFYILMLLMTIFSLVLRVSGARRSTTPSASGGTTAHILVFHHEDGSSCEDLAITGAGDAVFSNCGNDKEKQYALSSSERAQVQAWIDTYKTVNYDHNEPAQAGDSKTQLYLNGRGSRQANEADVQRLIDFAETLASSIASQS